MNLINTITRAEAHDIRFILMDIDDTLTTKGKLSAGAYQALWDLKRAGLKLIPITGRPGGWCDLIAREWPVDGVVGENGAFVFWEEHGVRKELFHPSAVPNDHPILKHIREQLSTYVPQVRIAKDQFARLFDYAFDFAEEEPKLPLSVAEQVRDIALSCGAQAKISSIHVNVWLGQYDKRSTAELFLSEHFGWRAGIEDRAIFFVGDSPNDEPLFERFPLTAAVATITQYHHYMHAYPRFIAGMEGGEGFAEIAAVLLNTRRNA
ncbi:MAG: HAD-IIB family hydrolase [Treponema sp.]|jgi:HAD superfamily hydrolase (TIGR01484 family)|nr:HAD-IIB family hydrolase [Treponema sp.]